VRCLVWICGSLALIAALPPTARAYEDQATLGFAVGYLGVPGSTVVPPNGVDGAVSAGGGIGDAWNIQGLVSFGALIGDPRVQLGTVGLEAVYTLDIVRFVPLLGVGLDGLLSIRDRRALGDFALHFLVGFDFLINRRLIFGGDFRGYWVATNARSRLDPFVVRAGLRIGVRFDLP
jgi:hypothetical protein